tara:strand:- start:9963 stop:10808 length:846 start_codon:yes stop_codon:yes gene_type:complete
MATIVAKLLCRGDEVSIEHGRLVIRPASGKTVPQGWYKENAPIIIREILRTLSIEAYQYRSYKTGYYQKGRLPGVHLHFCGVISGNSAYSIFNAELTRRRSTKTGKAGTALPDGRFSVGELSHFYKLWIAAGLKPPRRLSAFHDYMGKLGEILFYAEVTPNRPGRLQSGSFRPASLSAAQTLAAFFPDNPRTNPGQHTDKRRTTIPDNHSALSQADQGFQRLSTTCQKHYENTVISNHEDTTSAIPPTTSHDPRTQTTQEWLDDRFSADGYSETYPLGYLH